MTGFPCGAEWRKWDLHIHAPGTKLNIAYGAIDWDLKDSVRAAMRAKIRRLLAKYDYPPDHERRAIELVLEQAELFATESA